MKIERVALTGFTSHTATDWNPDGARLVSIVGPNGAGKSSLLDGIAYSLFDAARGKTDDLVQLGATNMAATVEFTLGGQRYRVTRGRTTKAGGKSFLELAVGDGAGWTPLTRESIRETQQAIEELLHVDARTFTSAVFLQQGGIDRFIEATAAERKRVLSEVLGLDLYQRAEQRAREEARDVEGFVAIEKSQAERLDEQLARRPEIETDLARGLDSVAQAEADIGAVEATRTVLEARARELAQQLASGEAAQRDVDRITGAIRELLERHRRTSERRQAAEVAVRAADAGLADSEGVTAAVAGLAGLREAVEAWEAKATEDRRMDADIRTQREKVQQLGAQHDQEHARWQATYEATRGRVDELVEGVKRLTPVTCPHCSKAFELDQAGLKGKLQLARSQFKKLESEQPAEPLGVARERAGLERLEGRRRELAYDLAGHEAARRRLAETERIAARAEAIETHRAAKAQAEEAIAQVDLDLEAIGAAGNLAKASLEVAAAKAAGLEGVRTEQASIEYQLRVGATTLAEVQRTHTIAIALVARARADIEQLDRLQIERATLAELLDGLQTDLGRLRALVSAFGVNGIPARIIEQILPELADYAQGVLATLRPGMTVSIRAQRAKRDGKGVIEALDVVVRDGVGERPLAMFSGGERVSVALSLAVGLSRLVARRAGASLRSLVIDEPEWLDAEARRALGQALKVLSHQGALERVLLVTHAADLAEFGDAIYEVTKGKGGSVVEQVA